MPSGGDGILVAMDGITTCIEVQPGLRLRPWQAGDLDALLRHADDPGVSRGTSDRFPFPYTRADGEAFLAGRVVDFSEPVLAIEVDGEACGGIGARALPGERRVGAELGYWLGSAHWGKGLMTLAVSAFLPYTLATLQVSRVQANVLDFNIGSARVLEKSGAGDFGAIAGPPPCAMQRPRESCRIVA